uniref:Disease resistance protein RPS6 n=1 Tax=Noccaea caerulescens TaxID=107243 RepID=A0A1J3IBH6_NOCCA
MPNLQFLKIGGDCNRLCLPQSFSSISRKLRLLGWTRFPMTSLPPNFDPKFLVDLSMPGSKLEKLWDGNKPLRNLKRLDLSHCVNLKKLPDLSTATNLDKLVLSGCSSLLELSSSLWNPANLGALVLIGCLSLVKLPSSIGNAINLTSLSLDGCSSLVELPYSIGNATNLKILALDDCSSLVELPFSIGNLHNLWKLHLERCSKLKVLPININMKSLAEVYLRNCPMLKTFPEMSTNIKRLMLNGTPVEEVPLAVTSWPHLEELHMSYRENLKDLPHALNSITDLELADKDITELVPWIKRFSRLRRLLLNGFQKLVSLPQLPGSLLFLDAENCESLERLDCSFGNPDIHLNFRNCFQLNQEARDLIIQASNFNVAILPGGEVPAYFSDRATGRTLTVKLNERPLHKPLRFKGCVVLDYMEEGQPRGRYSLHVSYRIRDIQNGPIVSCRPGHHHLSPFAVTGHLYTFEFEADVTSNEPCFEFTVVTKSWSIIECGLLQLPPKYLHVDGTSD